MDYITGVGKLNGRLVILLDLNKIVRQRGTAGYRWSRTLWRNLSPQARSLGMTRLASQEDTREECPHSQLRFRSPAELKLLQTLVYQECGMFFDERRMHFLQDRLQRRLKVCQLDSFYGYYLLAHQPRGQTGANARCSKILRSTRPASFAYAHNSICFKKVVLEELLKTQAGAAGLVAAYLERGCSTGQEPYTLAILICDALAYYYLRNPLPFDMPTPKPLIPPPWKVEILASDINYSALLTAQQGIYTEDTNGDRRLHLPPALFRQGRRSICG